MIIPPPSKNFKKGKLKKDFKKMINLKVFINRKIKFNIEKSFIFNFLEMIVNLDAFTDKKINQKMKKVFIYKSFLKKFFTFQPVPKELITFKLFINREDLISI